MTKTRTVRGCVRTLSLAAPSVRAAADGSVTVSGLASTSERDRYETIIEPTAFRSSLRTYLSNPILLWQHRADVPVGKITAAEIRPNGVWINAVIVGGTRASDEAAALVRAKVVRAFSFGFIERGGAPDAAGVWHITDLEWLETSLVSIPGNASALFTVDERGLRSVELLEESDEDRAVRAALRRVRRVIAARIVDRAQLLAASKLLDVALRRLDSMT